MLRFLIMSKTAKFAALFLASLASVPLCGQILPPILNAASPASGQIRIAWHPVIEQFTFYSIYRALGPCSAPGPFTRIVNMFGNLSYLDTGLTDGQVYSYEIEDSIHPGPHSACVSARSGDPCVAPPVFPGLGSIYDGFEECALVLVSDDARPLCGASSIYNVYRSTDPNFLPGPENRIGFHLINNGYYDNTVAPNVTYYYIQHAIDTTNGLEEGNLERKSHKAVRACVIPVGDFYTLTPCRAVDTRNPTGTLAGPALQPSATRIFSIGNWCGLPPNALGLGDNAKAVAIRVTVTEATSDGSLRIEAVNVTPSSDVSTINFSAGQTRTNNAIVSVGALSGAIQVTNQSDGTVHFILDVAGYFN